MSENESAYTAFAFNVLESKLMRTKHRPLSDFTKLPSTVDNSGSYPLFVSWDKYDDEVDGYYLRGCIGTFESDKPLEEELVTYTLLS